MAERKDLERQRKRQELAAQSVDEAIKALLTARNGQEFLWWLLSITRHMQTPFTGNALTTAFAAGEQNIGLQLMARMQEVDAGGYLRMLEQRKADNERYRHEHTGGYDSAGDDDTGVGED